METCKSGAVSIVFQLSVLPPAWRKIRGPPKADLGVPAPPTSQRQGARLIDGTREARALVAGNKRVPAPHSGHSALMFRSVFLTAHCACDYGCDGVVLRGWASNLALPMRQEGYPGLFLPDITYIIAVTPSTLRKSQHIIAEYPVA
jgi:hypothetical protein